MGPYRTYLTGGMVDLFAPPPRTSARRRAVLFIGDKTNLTPA